MKILRIILLAVGAGLTAVGWAYWTAISDPVVREVELPLLPVDAIPTKLRVLLMTDIHVAAPDMPPSRLRRIVAQANALKPDVIFITGDLVSDKLPATRIYSLNEAIAPLAGLEARLGLSPFSATTIIGATPLPLVARSRMQAFISSITALCLRGPCP
ncbi:metallophosphoesterase [Sphingomonas sp. LHG3443-2]|uniref:metallophosphoesterase n=1 Tax=Sphingomonas sp. LHG3443-2 TaxID=2804639 RepID=UPI003CECA83E